MKKYLLSISTWDNKEVAAIEEVIKSDHYTMGSQVLEFEKKFAEYQGSRFSVMVNSGSSANLIAVAALFFTRKNCLKPGDEVIVPALSWATTYSPLQQYGLKLKFVDINQETLNINLDDLKTAISAKTRLILAVNVLGNPNEFDKINNLLKEKDILLVEDNCESLGASYKGKKAGTFGIMGTHSSFFSHHISTMEGGIISTDNEELYQIMLSLRSHGWTRHLPEKNLVSGRKSEDPFDECFKFFLPGYNLRPIEMSGAIGLKQLDKLPMFIEKRRENSNYFLERLSAFPTIQLQKEVGESSWFAFTMTFENQNIRDSMVKLYNANEIECRPIVAGNFTKTKAIQFFDYSIHKELTNTDNVDRCGLYVGNHHIDMRESIDHLCNVTRKVIS